MLQEVLQNTKGELVNIIQKVERLQQEKKQIELKIQEIKEEILSLNKTNRSLSIYTKRNPIVEFFMKTFSKKYKKELKEVSTNNTKLEQLNQEMSNLRTEKRKLDLEEQVLNPELAKNQLNKMNKKSVAIQMIITKNTNITKNPDFMKDLISLDLKYIEYDKTNDEEVYAQYLEGIKAKLEEEKSKQDSNKFLIDIPLKTAKDLINKLRNPKEFEEGKYNIPNRFLFEALRKTSKRDLESIGSTKTIDILSNGREYLREDGKYPKEYGKKIEELYEDKNKILYQHIINSNEHFKNNKEIENIKKSIFVEGLHSSLQGNGYSNSLEKTAHGNYEEDISFVDFLVPSYKILIMIPKNVLNRNYEVQVWGSNYLEINKEHPCYILPEYIYGYVNPDNEEIEENTIPLKKRKKYKYKFCNEQTSCLEEQESEMFYIQ